MNKPFSSVDEWLNARLGKFTSSEIYKLLGNDKKGSPFGTEAFTYIKQKAVERTTNLWERPELEEAKALLWGKVHELPAYEWYINTTKNYSMQYLGTETPLFLEYEPLAKDSGGSPDGVVVNESYKVELGLESKCPKNPVYHFDRLVWKDQWDILENYPLVYAQMQHLLMITGASEWHFLSFDDRQRQYKNKGKIIAVKPDKKFQDNLDIRIRLAIKKRDEFIQLHTN